MPQPYVVPPELPLAMPDQQFEFYDIAISVEKDQGELRRLPMYARAPTTARVTWPPVGQEAFDAFWDWYEDDLLAGSRRFDIRLAQQGTAGLRRGPRAAWYSAQFVEVPQVETLSRQRYQIKATLLLIGAPFDTRTAPGLLASGVNARSGGARVVVASIVASGTNSRDGGAVSRDTTVRASGTNGRDGGWNTGVAPLGADEALAALWFGIELDDTADDAQDAQTADFADFGP